MSPAPAQTSLLDTVIALCKSRLSGAAATDAERFISRYYAQVDQDDLHARGAPDIFGAAMAHRAFARDFAGGAPKIRIYNPREDEHGWASANTVIEIVNDDMPFLIDSVTMEVNRQGYAVQLLAHPIYAVRRDAEGHWLGLDGEGARAESFIHMEVERESDPARIKALGQGLSQVLGDVRAAVADWAAMRAQMQQAAASVRALPPQVAAETAEIADFLAWAHDDHFTFLGFRDYDLEREEGELTLRIVPNSGLGVLREPRTGVSASFRDLPPEIRAEASRPTPLLLTKANSRSTVHRPGYLDYIGVKRFNAAGEVIGERRFVGLYTSSAYTARPDEVPLLRDKVAQVIDRAGFSPSSHMGKNLVSVLETYPRDELFQIDADTLYDTALGIVRLGDRRKTRVFLRRDTYGRYCACLIYLPREHYNTETRVKVQQILRQALNATSSEFTVRLSDAVLARIHMLVRGFPVDAPMPDPRAIEAAIVQAIRGWDDDLALAFVDAHGASGSDLLRGWRDAFPLAYRESNPARTAVKDIGVMRALSAEAPLALTLYRPAEAGPRNLRLRLYKQGEALRLSDSLPMLENMGVTVEDERSYDVTPASGGPVHIHDFGLSLTRDLASLEQVKPLFEDAFMRVSRREVENDGFNRLTLAAELSAAEIAVLRAYARYLKQTGFTFSQSYVDHTLAAHPQVTRDLAQLFAVRFDPAASERASSEKALVARLENALDAIANLDEDRILRRYLAVILATVRTNAYQRIDGAAKPYLSFKLDSARVPELPQPRPLYEIFVYSPRVEAIHLRGGKVARGGLRWSDRMEDFRTEVLGLMKAQMTKNSVIVPVGSKGGFVVKNPPPLSNREAYQAEGVACYRMFLSGLLDITDNLVAGSVVPPPSVVRHDGDDPYLVVAADKGTATFSDIANAVSRQYGFWLGDAFASGGSAGYDHKKMGITAKGAWESVKRHFRERGHNTQTHDFTVVGIGDMSGDVFGNGMLLSRHIRLLAAFDHRHIFLDPNPDSAASFAERERLFALPRSSWEDYNPALIAEGGGVFPRSAKSIPITPQVGAALAIEAQSLTPNELISAILRAPVDMLYNGGIGTYVKAAGQSHAEVGDRATDAIRVNGRDLRCKVVVEGGNLGFTQLGRIEFEQAGGRIYTDAIDNSAGVDCSDHEVNIKILLAGIAQQGELTEKQRNTLLAEMTDEVGRLVLADNYYQTQSLAVSGVRSEKLLDAQQALVRAFEKMGRLNRAVEYLPSDDAFAERRANKQGLTAPERAVLLAYSKMVLFDQLLAGTLIDEPYLQPALVSYFPKPLQARYPDAILRHPLRREITATVVVNSMINRVGSVFVQRMQDETGASPEEVVRAYLFMRDIFNLESLWRLIDQLDYQVAASLQSQMMIDAGRLMLRGTLWFLRRRREKLPIGEVIALFRPGVAELSALLSTLLTNEDREAVRGAVAQLESAGVPPHVAARVAALDPLYGALDIAELALEHGLPAESMARLYYAQAGALNLRWIGERIAQLPTDTPWQSQARNALRDDLAAQQRAVTAAVARLVGEAGSLDAALDLWRQRATLPITRLHGMIEDFRRGPQPDLAMLSVLLRELRALV
jgi:glutamate dehydrogenase